MKWSKLKKLVEESFAESVKGRIKIYSTRYGTCECGRGWVTVDGKELADFNTKLSGEKYGAVYHETTETICKKHPSVLDGDRVTGNLVEPGEFSRFDLYEACWKYIHSNINISLKSKNPIVVSLAVLNAKVGANRLRKISLQKLHPLTRALLEFRIVAEEV